MTVARRLAKIEAAFGGSIDDETRAAIDRHLSNLPPRRELTEDERRRAESFGSTIKVRITEPKQQIEFARRYVAARRRLFLHENGQDALDAFDRANQRSRHLAQ